MYVKNPEFEEPTDDTIIWRYVDFIQFISYGSLPCIQMIVNKEVGF